MSLLLATKCGWFDDYLKQDLNTKTATLLFNKLKKTIATIRLRLLKKHVTDIVSYIRNKYSEDHHKLYRKLQNETHEVERHTTFYRNFPSSNSTASLCNLTSSTNTDK